MILDPPHITIQGIINPSYTLPNTIITMMSPCTRRISDIANIKYNTVANQYHVIIDNGSYILNATGTQNKRYLYYQITQHEYIEIAKALFPDRLRKPIPAYDELQSSTSKVNNAILSIELEEETKNKPYQLIRIIGKNRLD